MCAVGSTPAAEAGASTPAEGGTGAPVDAAIVPPHPMLLDAASQRSGCAYDVAIGVGQTCIRKIGGGTAECWGSDLFGELGDGMASDLSAKPVRVAPNGGLVWTVFAGYHRSCVQLLDGTLWCSGANEHGQLGDGSVGGDRQCGSSALDCQSTFVKVQLGVVISAIQNPQSHPVAMGHDHTCALTQSSDFSLSRWGSNDSGQLGTGRPATTVCSGVPCENAPVPVTLLGGNMVESISAGDRHTCALLKDATVSCWGDDRYAQLSTLIPGCNPDGGVTPCFATAPTPVAALGNSVLQLVSGRQHNCVRRNDGSVWCWGRNDLGQLGDGTASGNDCPGEGACKATPVQVEGLPADVDEIAARGDTTCAHTTSANVWCWGSNANGHLGAGPIGEFSTLPVLVLLPIFPTRNPPGTGWAMQVVVGETHSCAIMTGNDLECWGSNKDRQFGDGTTLDRVTPAFVNVCL